MKVVSPTFIQQATNRATTPVALKILKPEHAGERSRLRAEWETLRALNHAHVVRVFDFHDDDDATFFAQYLVDGPSLADIGRVDPADGLAALALVCRALAYLHARDVVHGDVAATNILFDQGGSPFLIDFGSARRGDIVVGLGDGTPALRSPERGAGDTVEARDDLYALGMLMRELVEPAPADSVGPGVRELIRDLTGPRRDEARCRVGAGASLCRRPHAEIAASECYRRLPRDAGARG